VNRSDFTDSAPGELVSTIERALAFLPVPLPPKIGYDEPLVNRLTNATLAIGLGTAGLFAVLVGVFLDQLSLLPEGFNLNEFSAAQTHVNTTTILVALAAGIAGMLAVETRASSAVGVAISVTTIPAAAYVGIAIGIGEFRTSLSGLAVLGVNVAMMLTGGSIALAVQRMAA